VPGWITQHIDAYSNGVKESNSNPVTYSEGSATKQNCLRDSEILRFSAKISDFHADF